MTHKYIGTKIVLAWASEKDGVPGYGVKYEDGYTSWSPKDVFEAAYRDIEGPLQSLNFGDAVHMLKLGKKLARAGWNGSGMWVTIAGPLAGTAISHEKFWSKNNAQFAYDQPNSEVTVRPYFTIKTANNEISSWAPSVGDCLAEDWQTV